MWQPQRFKDVLDEAIRLEDEKLADLCKAGWRDEPRRVLEYLGTLVAARWISQLHGYPINDFKKMDEPGHGGIQGGVDLQFALDGHEFVIEATRLETWPGQVGEIERYAWERSGQYSPRTRVRPRALDNLPEERVKSYRKAVEDKAPKLANAREQILAGGGSCTSVLLVEDFDWIFSNALIVADTLYPLLMAYTAAPRPDCIILLETVREPAPEGKLPTKPIQSGLFVPKWYDSITVSREFTGEKPKEEHGFGPYSWDEGTRVWMADGQPFYPRVPLKP